MGSTVGQELLELKYKSLVGSDTSGSLTRHEKAAYAALTVIIPWLVERAPDLRIHAPNNVYTEKVWKM